MISKLGPECAEGTQEAVDAAWSSIKDGSLKVFDTSKFTVPARCRRVLSGGRRRSCDICVRSGQRRRLCQRHRRGHRGRRLPGVRAALRSVLLPADRRHHRAEQQLNILTKGAALWQPLSLKSLHPLRGIGRRGLFSLFFSLRRPASAGMCLRPWRRNRSLKERMICLEHTTAIELRHITKAVRQGGCQRRHLPGDQAGRDPLPAGGERQRQDHADEHAGRHLLPGRREDPGERRAHHHCLPQGRLCLRHRHDPPALQAGGRVHRSGKHRPGAGRRAQAGSEGRLRQNPGDLREIRFFH